MLVTCKYDFVLVFMNHDIYRQACIYFAGQIVSILDNNRFTMNSHDPWINQFHVKQSMKFSLSKNMKNFP